MGENVVMRRRPAAREPIIRKDRLRDEREAAPTQAVAEQVGVRALKTQLSRYLRRVARGESIVVTDRGEPVARIIPAGVPEGIARLIRADRIQWSGRKPQLPKSPVTLKLRGRTLTDLLLEDRE